MDTNTGSRSKWNWVSWAERHPAAVAWGVLLLAGLLLLASPGRPASDLDPPDEESPLFI